MVSIGNFDSFLHRQGKHEKKLSEFTFEQLMRLPRYMDADSSHSFTVSALFMKAFIYHQ